MQPLVRDAAAAAARQKAIAHAECRPRPPLRRQPRHRSPPQPPVKLAAAASPRCRSVVPRPLARTGLRTLHVVLSTAAAAAAAAFAAADAAVETVMSEQRGGATARRRGPSGSLLLRVGILRSMHAEYPRSGTWAPWIEIIIQQRGGLVKWGMRLTWQGFPGHEDGGDRRPRSYSA